MRTIVADTLFAFASAGITAALVAMSAPAAAADIETAPRQVAVATSDLNLATPAGHSAAERRIRAAAAEVCATGDDRFPVDGRCRAAAIQGAAQALDARTAGIVQVASN